MRARSALVLQMLAAHCIASRRGQALELLLQLQ
jgi:hypothetical protein